LMDIRVAQVRLRVEIIALPQCPRCHVAVEHVEGCAAITCKNPDCGCRFCGYCLEDCGDNAHFHVKTCQYKPAFATSNFGTLEESRVGLRTKIKHDLTLYWNQIDDPELKREAAKNPEVAGWLEFYQVPIE
jgi:hypothetical protein